MIAAPSENLLPWLLGRGKVVGKKRKGGEAAQLPAVLPPYPTRGARRAATALATQRQDELVAFLSALKIVARADTDYLAWFEMGAAIHDYDPGPNGLKIFQAASWLSEKHRTEWDQAKCEEKWVNEYGKRTDDQGVKRKTSIYLRALQLTEEAQSKLIENKEVAREVEEKPQQMNGHHSTHVTIFDAHQKIIFPDLNKLGKPVATCRNARVAIRGLGLTCENDLFHEKMKIGGQAIGEWAGELTDSSVQMLRVAVERAYHFDPGTVNAFDAATQECLQHTSDPICDYLDGLKWDGRKRLDRWLVDYLGAEDTPFNREVGKLTLVAAVRRARQPGCKFDQILVLEGSEGAGKSTAIEILAGTNNFSDQTILGLDDKGHQEALQGVWIYEIADLAGISKADVERIKAFASRTWDRARPAYGRRRFDKPRRCVFIGTTNNDTYLKSQTGNRRFWPVRCLRALLTELARDRDQLWAEAAMLEANGVSLLLPEKLWPHAAQIQDTRRDHDPWDDILAKIAGNTKDEATSCRVEVLGTDGRTMEWRISSRDVLDVVLKIPTEKQNDVTAKRVAYVMRRLGWFGPAAMKIGGAPVRGYARAKP